MATPDLIIRPIARKEARAMCEDHPHAGTLPNSSKYYMRADIDGRPAGLAVWGYGIRPTLTPAKLFDDGALGVDEYLELCRFFVYDWAPPNTASKFLAATHRVIRRHAPRVKILYTYAAGFQGLVGYIYQASGYDYLGTREANSFLWIPGRGLVHAIALFHRYGKGIESARDWQGIFPGSRRWHGLNFCYMYWLCNRRDKRRLMRHATFKILPYPKDVDMEIWTVDADAVRQDISVADARTVPIVKLKSARARVAGPATPSPDDVRPDPRAPHSTGKGATCGVSK